MSANPKKANSIPSLAPHSPESEVGVLSACLYDPQLIADLARTLKPEAFFYIKHQWIYEAMVKLGDTTDTITLSNCLREKGQLDDIGGVTYLTGLMVEYGLGAWQAPSYATTIKEKHTRRRLIAAAQKQLQLATDESNPIEDVLQQAEREVLSVTADDRSQSGEWLASIAATVLNNVTERMETGKTGGLLSGFTELDDITFGWQKSDLVIIAGRPSMGKTALAINMMLHTAKEGIPVAFFSLEMSKEQIVERMVALETGINSTAIRTGRISPAELPIFLKGLDTVSKLPIFIDDTPNWNVIALKSECRRLVEKEGVGMVWVDYLQLLEGKQGGSNPENRTQEVSFISRHLKMIAKELNIPLAALSQLSRAVEQRADKHPQLSDLRESGSIEQDADVIAFIYRDDYYNDDTERPNQAEIAIAKQRNGSIGTAFLHFNKSLTKFSNLKHEILDTTHYSPRVPVAEVE